MNNRLKTVGIAVIVFGLLFIGGGGWGMTMAQDGYRSLDSFSEAQNVTLSYNEDGELVDRGTTEGAEAIMALLTEDWGYPIIESEFDSADPLVNTATEYMYQMATIAYHTLNGTQTVVLDEAVEYNGETFAAGPHEFNVDGRYWTDFDRSHPIEGPARGQAWSGTAHALIAELGVGTVTASTLKLALGVSVLLIGIGLSFMLFGAGLIWASRGRQEAGRLEWKDQPMEPGPTNV